MQHFTPVTLTVTILIAAVCLFMTFGPSGLWKKILSIGLNKPKK